MDKDTRKKNIFELTRCSVEHYKIIPKYPLTVVLDNVRSMYNVGAVFRTCDAFNVEEVILGGISGIPPHPEITKTALGAEESVRWQHVDNTLQFINEKKKEGCVVCVLEQAHGSIPLQNFVTSPHLKYILVAGNEVDGVDQKIVDSADFILEIPQHGVKHSLNVSVSVGIALWQMLSRQL